jgi:hypothetical protein
MCGAAEILCGTTLESMWLASRVSRLDRKLARLNKYLSKKKREVCGLVGLFFTFFDLVYACDCNNAC